MIDNIMYKMRIGVFVAHKLGNKNFKKIQKNDKKHENSKKNTKT